MSTIDALRAVQVSFAGNMDVNESRVLFKTEQVGVVVLGHGRQHKGCTDIGVPSERHFHDGGEYPDLRGIERISRRANECSLRVAEFTCDRLHLNCRESVGIQYDGKRIALEASSCEDAYRSER